MTTETTAQHDHPNYQRCGLYCPASTVDNAQVKDLAAMVVETYYAGQAETEATDTGFVMQLDDDAESQIEAGDACADGLTLGLGHLNGGGWGEVKLDWAAAQVLADELNVLLRQSRVNGWS